jgi:phosphohistidine phosphatase
MKSVLLFRHGKSDWSADFETDFDRPLAGRGRKASKRMGSFLGVRDRYPEVVYCSPAVRAKRTLEIAVEAGEWKTTIRYDDRLYGAEAETVLDIVRHSDGAGEKIMVVGHEPTMSACVELFTGAVVRFPTAAICRIDFDMDEWREVGPGEGEIIWHIPPRVLR